MIFNELRPDLDDFFKDFNYSLNHQYIYSQAVSGEGEKYVILNNSPYEDALMIEPQLGIHLYDLENELKRLLNYPSLSKVSLSYWDYLSELSSSKQKRYFIKNTIEFQAFKKELEQSLVTQGFYWLDNLIDEATLLEKLINAIENQTTGKSQNKYYQVCRILILYKKIRGNLTDQVFYKYYEALQDHRLPEHQYDQLLSLKKRLQRAE